MAEAARGSLFDLAPLVSLKSAALEPVLEEEIRAWRTELSWDYTASADLVRHYIDVQILNGFALLGAGEALGYAYFVVDERKGLIGNLFVRRQWRGAHTEHQLLEAVVKELVRSPAVRRIESQLMMFSTSRAAPLPQARFVQLYPRNFMLAELDGVSRLAAGAAAGRVAFENWTERHLDEAARLIEAAYRGHVDSHVNNQYNSAAGARRFLHNIVEYPGCGTFFGPASLVAVERGSAEPCGISLASLVASDIGHITQICVLPRVRGAGVGYELLRRSMLALREHGCRGVSLTVTATNRGAVALYERIGFRTVRRFDAIVWDGF